MKYRKARKKAATPISQNTGFRTVAFSIAPSPVVELWRECIAMLPIPNTSMLINVIVPDNIAAFNITYYLR
jgi:hypothetical protein